MNKSFKVVFSKARGALMVVNELTSSVQAKGTKTVIAAAVATMVAGAAVAAEPSTTLVVKDEASIEAAVAATEFVGYTSKAFKPYNDKDYKSGAVYIMGQTVKFKDNVKFEGNKSDWAGGALELQSGNATLKDAVFTNNTAESWGGAVRMAGNSALTLEVTKDTVYAGNKANVSGKNTTYSDMGDFAYMNGALDGQQTKLALKAAKDTTLTIKDSIASVGSNNLLEVAGAGTVDMQGSMESYTGDITVTSGVLKVAGGFASTDLYAVQNPGNKMNSFAEAKLTVKDGAKAELGALTVTRMASTSKNTGEMNNKAGTTLAVEAGGELVVDSIHVTSKTYGTGDEAWTSYGWGVLKNAGTATVTNGVTVDAGTRFDTEGNVKIGSLNVAAGKKVGDKLNPAAGVFNHENGTLTLTGAQKSVNAGKFTVGNLVLEKGAVLETVSSWIDTKDAFIKAGSIKVNEGATLKFTDFNTNLKAGRGDDDAKNDPKDQVLITTHLILNGGSLGGLENLKVSTKTEPGQLEVLAGDYTFKNLTLGRGDPSADKKQSAAAGPCTGLVVSGGSMTVDSMYVNSVVDQTAGAVTLNKDVTFLKFADWNLKGGTLSFAKDLKFTLDKNPTTDAQKQVLHLQGGELQAWNSQIFGQTTDKAVDYKTASNFVKTNVVLGQDSVVNVLDAVELDADTLKEAAKALEGTNLLFSNLTFKPAADGKAPVFDQAFGTTLVNETVAAPEADKTSKTATLTVDAGKTVGVGALEVSANTETIKVAPSADKTGTGTLVFGGKGGDLIKGVATVKTLETAGNLKLGLTDTMSGNLNVATVKAEGDVDVLGKYIAHDIEANKLNVKGELTAGAVTLEAGGKVDGVLTVDTLTSKAEQVTVTDALVVNGAFDKDGKALVDIKGKVDVKGEGAVLTTNRAGFQAAAAKLDKDDLAKSIIYVDRALNLDGAELNVGVKADNSAAKCVMLFATAPQDTTPPATPVASSVTIGSDGLAVVNADSFLGKKNAVFGDATVDATAGEILLVNVNKLGDVKLGKSVTFGDNPNVDTDSLYVLVGKDSKFAEGVASLVYAKGLHNDKTVDARLEGLFKQGASAKEMAVLNTLDNVAYVTEDKKTGKDHFNALGEAALEQATGGNATAGVFNVAYDANAQVTDAIARHQLAAHNGMGVWADVFYAKNEAKEVYGNYGYSADIYGGVLGFDATFSCGATAGLALSVGSADADSEGGVFANKLESDFWGLSVYTAQDFGGLNVKADLGYMDFSNDFKGLGDASDATTLTFGVRGDYTVFQSGAFSITPHAGLRYTRIDTDAVAFNDEQKMNVFELPVGVKFAGTFETNGWKVVPSYDFTVVPQVGDKEVKVFGKAGDMTVLTKGLFNNVIGVEATNGNLTFGLNAVYGAGSDDRSNTQINANVRYNF